MSVLPDPVGARISVWSPAAIAGHPCAWAAVGAAKVVSNQVRTGSENRSSATIRRYRRRVTATFDWPRGALAPFWLHPAAVHRGEMQPEREDQPGVGAGP